MSLGYARSSFGSHYAAREDHIDDADAYVHLTESITPGDLRAYSNKNDSS